MLLFNFLLACHPDPIGDIFDKQSPPGDSQENTSTSSSGTPVCGDEKVDGIHEECDGADDESCPGACSDACQCPGAAATGKLEVDMINVGQGDGLLVISPDGFTMLVDAGDEPTHTHLEQVLSERGVVSLDYTLVSHQHSDHMGAMDLALRDHLEAGVAYDGGGFASTDAYRDYITAASDRRHTVLVGDLLDLGPSMKVEVLHSDIGDRDNENNNSVVIKLTYGSFTMLMGGDCEAERCESAIHPGAISVYKVHHHGSSDSSSWNLLKEMNPKHALISVGLGNDYGHPHASTLSDLDEIGAQIWRTDQDGDVGVIATGSSYTVAPF